MSGISLLEWLQEPASVNREVNMGYLLVVTIISLCVLAYAILSKDKRAQKFYMYSLIVWPLIEGFGLVTGMRVYEGTSPWLVWFVVGFMEDPGWVCLAFIISQYWARKFGLLPKKKGKTKE